MSAEFQVVITALNSAEEEATVGFTFSEVTESEVSDRLPRPKCLFPICNRPLLLHQLDWLSQEGFDEVIVVVRQWAKRFVEKAVLGDSIKPKIKVTVHAVSDDFEFESADALRELHKTNKLSNTDLLVLECGFVTNMKLCEIANTYRQSDAFGVLMLDTDRPLTDTVPCSNQRRTLRKEIMLIAPNGQLLSTVCDNDSEKYVVPSRILASFADATIHTRYYDAQLYLFRHSVLDFLARHAAIHSVKLDLIPAVIKRSVGSAGRSLDSKSLSHRNYQMKCAYTHAVVNSNEYFLTVRDRASWMETNRQLLKVGVLQHKRSAETATSGNEKIVGTEYAIGADCVIGEACALRKSAIGARCQLGRKVTLTNCILLDGVKVADGCKLSGCVVGDFATLQDAVELRDCVVTARLLVASRTSAANEMLLEAETETPGLDDEDDDEEDEKLVEGDEEDDSDAESEVD